MNNVDIRNAARIAGIPLWKIGNALGYSDSYFSKLLRKEFTDERKRKVLEIIKAYEMQQG